MTIHCIRVTYPIICWRIDCDDCVDFGSAHHIGPLNERFDGESSGCVSEGGQIISRRDNRQQNHKNRDHDIHQDQFFCRDRVIIFGADRRVQDASGQQKDSGRWNRVCRPDPGANQEVIHRQRKKMRSLKQCQCGKQNSDKEEDQC